MRWQDMEDAADEARGYQGGGVIAYLVLALLFWGAAGLVGWLLW